MPSPNGNGVWKTLFGIAVAIILTGGAAMLALGTKAVTRDEFSAALVEKANKETVDVQFQNIIDQLERINLKLDRMEGNDD